MGEMDMESQPESDTTTAEQLSRDERAEQRRAEARAQLEASTHFDTPSWMGPRLREYVAPQVPEQSEPSHDELHAYAPVPVADPVPEAAHWVEHRKPRVFVGLLLVLALAGAIAAGVFAVLEQSLVAGVGLVVLGFIAVLFRGALMSSGLTTVDLKNSTLKVRQDGELSIFNLADPSHRVEITGTPGSTDWQVALESIDHRELVLTAAHVDPVEFDKIVTHYRAIAERERQDRFERFNR